MIRLPQNNIWKQFNRSTLFGDLWRSQNLDLTSQLGKIRVSPRLYLTKSSDDDANLGIASSIKFFVTTAPNYVWATAGTHIYKQDINGNWTLDATSGTPGTLNPDMTDSEVFNSHLYVGGDVTTMYKLSATETWSSVSSAFTDAGGSTSTGVHCMTYYRALNRLYYVDNASSCVRSLDTSDTVASLGSQYTLNGLVDGVYTIITWIRSTSNLIWIGTLDLTGRQAKVYAWDGSVANVPNEIYTIEDDGSLACVIQDDVPVIVTTKGKLMKLNGGTFVELDRFPLEATNAFTFASASPTSRFIHFNGIDLVNGNIQLFINADYSPASYQENISSGVWEYTKETGLYHKNSLGLSTFAGTIKDYGQQKLSKVGAFAQPTKGKRKVFLGCQYYTDATTTKYGLFEDDFGESLQKGGSFITSQIFSKNIQDVFERIILRARKLLTTTDSITIKYRMDFDPPVLQATITWTSTSSFTTSTDLSDYKIGDEVEVVQGIGAGKTSHITAIQATDSGYMVTVDETYTGATGTAIAQFQNWRKLCQLTNQTVNTSTKQDTSPYIDQPIFPNKCTWIQFKVSCVFTGAQEIYDIIIPNKNLQ